MWVDGGFDCEVCGHRKINAVRDTNCPRMRRFTKNPGASDVFSWHSATTYAGAFFRRD
jgi:hypothetical protein